MKKKTNKKTNSIKNEIITTAEFSMLLKQVTPENVITTDKNNHSRSYYRPWLTHVFEIVLYTGARMDEFARLKWTDIVHYESGKLLAIEISIQKTDLLRIHPITKEFENLLLRLGYQENIGANSYLLAPDDAILRSRVMHNFLSSAFAHYYKQLNTGKHISFRALRTTYKHNLSISNDEGLDQNS